ncbi:cation:proton antiporter [Streptomyces sp. NPDC013455]|uniref:cation:proton antiporter domain-containing protein n=1 Tax=Streptomyces sp. NPDC013455 TaxID=3155605 RepID=UPI0033C69A41
MSAPDPLPDLLLAVPAVILACGAGARLARRVGQPPVVGEIAAGIALGPSLLGWLAPDAQHWLFPASVMPYLSALGNLGLLAFMFLIGLELDLGTLRRARGVAVAVSVSSLVVPFALGSLTALAMYDRLAAAHQDRLPFLLFIAIAMSITAFPVLARILIDRGMYTTPLGTVAMASAAVNDVCAWCLLAVVAAVSTSSSPDQALVTVAEAVGFALVMGYVVRPVLARLAGRAGRVSESMVLVLVFSGVCLSSLATDRIGVHAVFGAFLFGAVTPRGSVPIERAAGRMQTFAVPVLLPLFFVGTGMNTDLTRLVGSAELWGWTALLLAVAMLGKWGGSTGAARLAGQSWRDAMSIGALMNCRGLTELVVLNVGLQLKVISIEVFSMLVVVALVTTAATTPALEWFGRIGRGGGDGAPGSAVSAEPDDEPAASTAVGDEPGEGTAVDDEPAGSTARGRRP